MVNLLNTLRPGLSEVMISYDLIHSFMASITRHFQAPLLLTAGVLQRMPILPAESPIYTKGLCGSYKKRTLTNAFESSLVFLMNIFTANRSLKFSKDLIISSLKHITVEFLATLLERCLMHRMLPEELKTLLNNESASYVKELCLTYLESRLRGVIRGGLLFLMSLIAAAVEKSFMVRHMKTITSFFKKKELREPTCAYTV